MVFSYLQAMHYVIWMVFFQIAGRSEISRLASRFPIARGRWFWLLAVAVSNDALSVFNIEGGQVSLFKDTDGNFTNDTALSSFAFDQAATFKQWSALAAGDYYYRIAGTVTGTQGGTYVLSSALMPIP